MGQRERSDDGRYTETVTPERVRDALTATADPVATTSDVADRLDCTTEAVRVKLVRLAEEGIAGRRKVGSSAVVWWPADAGSAGEAAAAGEDYTAGEERDPEDIMNELERFIEQRDAAGRQTFDPAEAEDDYYAREHVENLQQLVSDDE